MNKLESFVYNKVKGNYLVKNFVRNIYLGVYDLLPNYGSTFSSQPIIREGCFFGFHDINPFGKDNRCILANKLTIPLRMPTKDDILEVGIWSGEDFSEWEKVGETKAWNYHKGCRLQWLDEKRCIYNVADGNKLKSRIVDTSTRESSLVDWPIDSVSPDGQYATSFSYERLQKMMPGYGYAFGDEDSHLNYSQTKETGLYLIDLKENSRKLLVNLEQLASTEHEDDMDDSFHFVTHTEFSPSGRHVAFLHRWYKGVRHRTRLVVLDLETNDIFVSPTSGMVSHYHWNAKCGIIAYCSVEGVDSHVYFYGPDMQTYKRCGYPQLNSDGHQHFINDKEFIVDTYPDKRRHNRLYKVNVETDEVTLLANVRNYKRYASPSPQKHWSCDMHPRCSADGRWISFDAVFTGKRSLCIMRNVHQ